MPISPITIAYILLGASTLLALIFFFWSARTANDREDCGMKQDLRKQKLLEAQLREETEKRINAEETASRLRIELSSDIKKGIRSFRNPIAADDQVFLRKLEKKGMEKNLTLSEPGGIFEEVDASVHKNENNQGGVLVSLAASVASREDVMEESIPANARSRQIQSKNGNGVSIHHGEARRECDDMTFHYDAFSLIKAYVGLGDNIYRLPAVDFSNSIQSSISRPHFFLELQKQFNSLVRDGFYGGETEEDIAAIRLVKRSIWSGSFDAIKNSLMVLNQKNGYNLIDGEERIAPELILGALSARALELQGYLLYSEEIAEYIGQRHAEYGALQAKKIRISSGSGETLSTDDEDLLLRYRIDVEATNELASILSGKEVLSVYHDIIPKSRKTKKPLTVSQIAAENADFLSKQGWAYLFLDREKETLHLQVPYFKLFSKQYKNVVSHYRSMKRLNRIQVHISY